jgi:formimidoylglutamate deiminase
MKPLTTPVTLWAPRAWIDGAWQSNVLLRINSAGCWADVTAGVPAPPDANVLPGPVLPGMVNAHSHAFQRAFAGMAERRTNAQDDFWSWRDRMYGVAARIAPAQLRAIAAQLYSELLQGGYTQVCEFHYLHHAPDGSPYADPSTMSRVLAEAAAEAGIGLTLLPVLYERAGFAQPGLRDDQRRFATRVETVLALRDGVRALAMPQVNAGVAIHSLRAARAETIQALARRVADDAGPIHIHIAEQTREVEDCLAATGKRPIEWLAHEVPLDARWQLVHATHALPSEIDAVARSGAGVVLCPSTEANLGDGLADLPRWMTSATPLSLGSDSHVCRAWPEELRWLEYGQRLLHRRRIVAAAEPAGALFDRMLQGGACAAGFTSWGLKAGARADLLVIDPQTPGLLGMSADLVLDGLVFSTDRPAFCQTWVAGQRVNATAATLERFDAAMQSLWKQDAD